MEGGLKRTILDRIQQAQAGGTVNDRPPFQGAPACFQASHAGGQSIGLDGNGAAVRGLGDQIGQGLQLRVVSIAGGLADGVIDCGQM